MEKKDRKLFVFLFLLVVVLASCSLTIYVQKNNSNSTIRTENPITNSADSASINIDLPNLTVD